VNADSLPLVSVLLASRDGERYLPEALECLGSQTWPRLELILVDDGSRDGTPQLLERFAASRPAARVLRAGGIGLAGALALGAREASGEFLARHDDDDRSRPERIERQMQFFRENPTMGVVGTAAEMIDQEGRVQGVHPVPMDPAAIRRTVRRASPFVHGSVVMRRETYQRAGGYRAAFRSTEDLDLWLRLPEGTGLANLPERLYAWRMHPRGGFSLRRDLNLRYAAVARAFADERRRRGRDSYDLLERSGSLEEFEAGYLDRGRLEFYLGELYTREGRTADARRHLLRALSLGGMRRAAAPWWVLSWGVELTPRARRAKAVRAPA
jgi:glycosyltransferase involved in cell wall biosynthesis